MADLRAEFDDFLRTLAADGVACQPRGCSEREIAALEHKFGVTLPLAYRLYLTMMGHASGRLFTHDHLAVTYEYVLENREDLEGGVRVACAPRPPDFQLPARALVIAGRLGEQFEYIVCDHPDDSPVYYVNTWDRAAKLNHVSVLDWLRTWHTSALEAIRSGYFELFPKGTIP